MNQAGSTLAGIIFLLSGFYLTDLPAMELTGLLLVAVAFDFSTVYFVHSGVISGTFERLKYPKKFMKLHVGSGLLAYVFLGAFVVSLYLSRFDLFYDLFLVSWAVTYFSGVYSFLRLR